MRLRCVVRFLCLALLWDLFSVRWTFAKNCEYWADADAITHLRASDKGSLFRCLGYVHARDRGWEMDYFRRTLQGRRAEILGYASIESDFLMRWLGLSERARRLYEQMPSTERGLLDAYVEGVNQGFKFLEENSEKNSKGGLLPYEFRDFGYRPEKWEPEHTLGLVLLQSFDQTRRSFGIQIQEDKWKKVHGAGTKTLFDFEQLTGLPWETTILKEGEYPKRTSPESLPAQTLKYAAVKSKALAIFFTQEMFNFIGSFGGFFSNTVESTGSNNWVIGGSRSQSGRAWLANDPHLKLTYPTFWHWVSLDWDGGAAVGATFPGIPFIASGTNLKVSWGLTNSYLPVAQVFTVKEKELPKLKIERPRIEFKFLGFKVPFLFKTYQALEDPALNEKIVILPLKAEAADEKYVLRWSGFEVDPRRVLSPIHLLFVKSASEADRELSRLDVPSWNFVFADVGGKIGYRAVGLVPRFETIPFGVMQSAWTSVVQHPAFRHFLTPEEMPHVLAPQRDFIATANNLQWPPDSQWRGGHAQNSGFRAFRIEELLLQTPRHDFRSLQQAQCDVQAVDARFLVPKLLEVLEKDGSQFESLLKELPRSRKNQVIQALAALRAWNFETNADCLPCGFFRRWMDRIYESQKLNTVALYRSLVSPVSSKWVGQLFDSLVLALKDIRYFKLKKFIPWSEIHQNEFSHLAGDQYRPISPLGTSGDDYSVNPGSSTWSGKIFKHEYGASHRLIVEMATPPRVYMTLPGPNHDFEERQGQTYYEKWIHCQEKKVEFPVDWKDHQSQIQRVDF